MWNRHRLEAHEGELQDAKEMRRMGAGGYEVQSQYNSQMKRRMGAKRSMQYMLFFVSSSS